MKDFKLKSPERINLIGEHTDYNGGYRQPTTIDVKAQFKLQKNWSLSDCRVYSKNFYSQLTFELDKTEPSENQLKNLILGRVHEIKKMTSEIHGFDYKITSYIPIGSWVSPSLVIRSNVC